MGSRLLEKKVLVTGTAGGQGEAAQALFAEEGATVVGCDLQPGGAEKTASTLRAEGHEVYGFDVDLADPDATRAWVEGAADRLGGIDILYNNAAGAAFAPFGEMTIELFRRVLRVELEVIFNAISPAWPLMIEGGGGVVINTASYSALRGIAPLGQVAHAAAKGGVVSMTRALAAEGAEHGIRVNALSPGLVKSPGTEQGLTDADREWQLGNHLIRRQGTGRDTAYLACYLASDESSWVTGQNFAIDGGATAGWR